MSDKCWTIFSLTPTLQVKRFRLFFFGGLHILGLRSHTDARTVDFNAEIGGDLDGAIGEEVTSASGSTT